MPARSRPGKDERPAPGDQFRNRPRPLQRLLTYIADKGWVDKEFIAASTNDFDKAVTANKTRLEDAAKITGLKPEEINKAAEWIAQPKEGGKRRRDDVRLREGPDLGQRQLPDQRRAGELWRSPPAISGVPAAAASAWAATRKAMCAPTTPVGRPAPYVDQLLIERQGRRPSHLGLRPLQDHAERDGVQARLQEAHRHGEGRHVRRAYGDRKARSTRSSARSRRAGCSRSMSTSSRPRSARPATSGCRRRPRAR